MRENRPYGSEGGVATSHPYPYHGWLTRSLCRGQPVAFAASPL